MPICAYWSPPEGDETTVEVRFEDAGFEKTETIDCVFEGGVFKEERTSDAVQMRAIELEAELAALGGD